MLDTGVIREVNLDGVPTGVDSKNGHHDLSKLIGKSITLDGTEIKIEDGHDPRSFIVEHIGGEPLRRFAQEVDAVYFFEHGDGGLDCIAFQAQNFLRHSEPYNGKENEPKRDI